MTWNTLVKAYYHGSIADAEFEWRLFTVLDDTNVGEFLAQAPAEVVNMVKSRLERMPVTDEDWSRMRIAGLEWRQEDTPKALADSRRGVEAMRRHLKGAAA